MNALFLSSIYSTIGPVNYLWLCWLHLFILKFTSVVMQSDAKLATISVSPQNNCSNEDLH